MPTRRRNAAVPVAEPTTAADPLPQAAAKRLTVPASGRTMALFEIFSRERRELTKSEAARLLDLPESSTSDLLSTLYQLGYLSRTALTRRYYPTNRLISLAADISAHHGFAVFGHEAAAMLAEKTGESAFCGILVNDHVELVAAAPGSQRLRYVANVGDSYTLHATAIGKAILGQLDSHEVDRLLALRPLIAVTDRTLTTPEAVKADIARAKEEGIYRTRGEGSAVTSAFAVAGRIGDQVVALCLIGPTERLYAHADQLARALAEVRGRVFE